MYLVSRITVPSMLYAATYGIGCPPRLSLIRNQEHCDRGTTCMIDELQVPGADRVQRTATEISRDLVTDTFINIKQC